MSIKPNLATAAFVVAVASLSAQDAAFADMCNGQWFRNSRGMVQCYYLPTVSDGRVTGLQVHVNNRPWNRGGAAVGGVSPHRWW
jgi:hypothetical protein